MSAMSIPTRSAVLTIAGKLEPKCTTLPLGLFLQQRLIVGLYYRFALTITQHGTRQ